MRDDVEDRVRAALREGAEEITHETLRRPTLREPRRSGGRPWLVAACFAAVVAVAAPVVVLSSGSGSSPGPSTSTAKQYVGYRWLVESITRNGRTTPVAADLEASAIFKGDGRMLLHDTANWLTVNIDTGSDVITIHDYGQTLRGYVGEDPVRLLVIDAMHVLASSKQASVSTTESTMTIAAGDFRIVFKRNGVAGTNAPISR